MFSRYVEINSGPRDLVIISDQVGKFPQHYVRTKGWYTCLDRWTTCPFCQVDNGSRYQRKVKYYFEVIELDQSISNVNPKVLLLSKSRGEGLLHAFSQQDSMLYKPFRLQKKDVGVEVSFIKTFFDSTILKDVLHHDWQTICRPLTKERATELVENDKSEYNNS